MLIGENAASEITRLKPRHCGCRYISAELRYAAIPADLGGIAIGQKHPSLTGKGRSAEI
jgi:hypothetical protein